MLNLDPYDLHAALKRMEDDGIIKKVERLKIDTHPKWRVEYDTDHVKDKWLILETPAEARAFLIGLEAAGAAISRVLQ